MRIKFLSFLSMLLLLLVPLGCTPAKKPETTPRPEPQTIVVPDISKINFETIDYEKAPEIVQALAKNLKDTHYATWTTVNGRNYVIVSQKNLPSGKGVQIAEIERRIPANNFDWINVKLKYLSTAQNAANGQKPDLEKPIVAAFTIDRPVKALGFELQRDANQARTPLASPATPTTPTTPAPSPQKSETAEKGLKLDAPKPGEQIKSPVQVTGTASGIQGTVRVRLKDASGLTLVEKPVRLNQGKFDTTMSFSSPANPEKGTIEAFVSGEDGVEKDMVSIPVSLQPTTTSEPETIGAP